MTALPKDVETALVKIDEIAKASPLLKKEDVSHIARAVNMSLAIKEIKGVLTVDLIQSHFMHLQGSPLGFLTDKDKTGGYDAETLQDVFAEAVLRGYFPVNNEFNVIAGRFYPAKNGLYRKVCELPGLTDLKLEPGVPEGKPSSGGAVVPFIATWRIDGKPYEMKRLVKEVDGAQVDQRIAVKVNAGMGADAIIGKAIRKMLAAIYNQVTGTASISEDDPDEGVRPNRFVRETGTLDESDLRPGTEPNRGHGDERMKELFKGDEPKE